MRLLLQMWPTQGNILLHWNHILNLGEYVQKAWVTSIAWHPAELETCDRILT